MKNDEELKTTRATIDVDWNMVLVALSIYWGKLDDTNEAQAERKEEVFQEIRSLSKQVGLNI